MINWRHETDIDGILKKTYFYYKRGAIGKQEALDRIIDTCNYFCESDDTKYSLEEIKRFILKAMYFVGKIGNLGESRMFEFLESQIIADDINVEGKREIYSLLAQYYPKRLKYIQKFLIENEQDFFGEQNIFEDGNLIEKAGLTDFIFRTFKRLSAYMPIIVFDTRMNCFGNESVIIVNKKFDPYKEDKYERGNCYANRGEWEFDNRNVYTIENRIVRAKELLFARNLFRDYIFDFAEDKMMVYMPNEQENPIRVDYEDSDVRFYIFNRGVYFDK